MAEELLTVKEVAKVLRTNVDYVYKLRDTGQLRFLKLGQWKIRRSTLDSFLADAEGKDISDPDNVVTYQNTITK